MLVSDNGAPAWSLPKCRERIEKLLAENGNPEEFWRKMAEWVDMQFAVGSEQHKEWARKCWDNMVMAWDFKRCDEYYNRRSRGEKITNRRSE